MKWNTLFAKASTGKLKEWTIHVENTGECPQIIIVHGYVGGKLKTDIKPVRDGKNIGKSNETTPYEQACNEAQARFQKQLDKNYSENPDNTDIALLPMLAQPYIKRFKDIIWSAFGQPKLDGVRCLATKLSDSEIEYRSRTGKIFTTLGHLTAELLSCLDIGDTFDGEIYVHRDMSFQEIVSALKKHGPNTDRLEYWVYDVVIPDMPFCDRLALRNTRLSRIAPLHIVAVDTIIIDSEEHMLFSHKRYTEEHGYEGIMIRNMTGKYLLDFRSADLQKYKTFVDEEFTIIGSKDGSGREEGKIIFICEDATGRPFDVRPRGTMELRTEWWIMRDSFLGKKLTVRYQRLSDDGCPIFPVGIMVRDYE